MGIGVEDRQVLDEMRKSNQTFHTPGPSLWGTNKGTKPQAKAKVTTAPLSQVRRTLP